MALRAPFHKPPPRICGGCKPPTPGPQVKFSPARRVRRGKPLKRVQVEIEILEGSAAPKKADWRTPVRPGLGSAPAAQELLSVNRSNHR